MTNSRHASPRRYRLMILTVLLLFSFLFIGLPSFGRYFLKTDLFNSLDMVSWMSRFGDTISSGGNTSKGEPSFNVRKGFKVKSPFVRSGVMDSSMGVMDSSMGVK